MKKFFFLLLGFSAISGMEVHLKSELISNKKIRIFNICNPLEYAELASGNSTNLNGFWFSFSDLNGIQAKLDSPSQPIEILEMLSPIALTLESFSSNICRISSPCLQLDSDNSIRDLQVSGNVILLNGGSVASDQMKMAFLGQGSRLNIYGSLLGRSLEINGDFLTIENRGSVKIDEIVLWNFSRESHINFLQWGDLCSDYLKQFGGSFANYGKTNLGNYELSYPTAINIHGGQFYSTKMLGKVSFLLLSGASFGRIDEFRGSLKGFKNRSGNFEIKQIFSEDIINLNSNKGARTQVGQSDQSVGTVICRDSLTELKNIPYVSMVDVLNGQTVMSDIMKVDSLKARKQSQIAIFNIGDVESAIAGGTSQMEICRSAVDAMKLNDRSVGKIDHTRVQDLTNNSSLISETSHVDHFVNRSSAAFTGDNLINVAENHSEIFFLGGSSRVDRYQGKDQVSKIEVLKVSETEMSQTEAVNSPVVLQSPGTSVFMNSVSGLGKISARQIYSDGFLKGFELNGNADIFLDYMPDEAELPVHNGDLNLHVTLSHNYINESNKIYGDTVFFIDMNGYDWKNIDADFIAGGMDIRNAGIMGNYNGRLGLQDFLTVKAEQILNISTPKERENGRWVHHDGFDRCPPIHFYMPATYYSMNQETGIFSNGNINLEAHHSVRNKFSTISSLEGQIQAKAGKEIRNTAGVMYASRKSKIEAQNIYNEDLGTAVRYGEFHTGGSSGPFWNRTSWHYDLYVAELVNQSHGAQMVFSDGVEFAGESMHVIGSKILSGKEISMNFREFDFQSVLDNLTEIGGKVYAKGKRFRGIAAQMWYASGEVGSDD